MKQNEFTHGNTVIFSVLYQSVTIIVLSSCLDKAFQSLDEETLEAMAKHETEEEKIFQMFKKQVAAEPEQVR